MAGNNDEGFNMSMDYGSAIAGGLNFVGGLLGSQQSSEDARWVAQYNHAAELESQAIANEFSSSQAAIAYARQMAMYRQQFADSLKSESTKYRRTVNDLRKAGINPLLAVGGLSGSGVSSVAPTAASPMGSVSGATPAHGIDSSKGVYSAASGLAQIAKATMGLDLQKQRAEAETAEVGTQLAKSQVVRENAEAAHLWQKIAESETHQELMKSQAEHERTGKLGQIYSTGQRLSNDFTDLVTDGFKNLKGFIQDQWTAAFKSHSALSGGKAGEAANDAIDAVIKWPGEKHGVRKMFPNEDKPMPRPR